MRKTFTHGLAAESRVSERSLDVSMIREKIGHRLIPQPNACERLGMTQFLILLRRVEWATAREWILTVGIFSGHLISCVQLLNGK
jgi:hypothetical protein